MSYESPDTLDTEYGVWTKQFCPYLPCRLAFYTDNMNHTFLVYVCAVQSRMNTRIAIAVNEEQKQRIIDFPTQAHSMFLESKHFMSIHRYSYTGVDWNKEDKIEPIKMMKDFLVPPTELHKLYTSPIEYPYIGTPKTKWLRRD